MSRHSCRPWTALRIPCPEGLLAKAAARGGGVDELAIPEDEVHETPESVPSAVPVDGYELERIVLLELGRQVKLGSKRKQTVEKLKERERSRHAVPPRALIEEAIRGGAKGAQLAIWIAAAATVGAVGLAFGPGAGASIPGIIRFVRGAARGKGGGVGFRLNDAARIQSLLSGGTLDRRKRPGGASGSGEFFPGILG